MTPQRLKPGYRPKHPHHHIANPQPGATVKRFRVHNQGVHGRNRMPSNNWFRNPNQTHEAKSSISIGLRRCWPPTKHSVLDAKAYNQPLVAHHSRIYPSGQRQNHDKSRCRNAVLVFWQAKIDDVTGKTDVAAYFPSKLPTHPDRVSFPVHASSSSDTSLHIRFQQKAKWQERILVI